jgi:fungal STAND N-terminal Goodbye domain
MSSTPTSSSSFQPIFDAALSDYAKKTGIDLATYPSAQTLQNIQSADAILDLLQDKAKQFSTYRDGNRKLIDCLKPVVQILHTVSAVLAEATAPVSHSDPYLILFNASLPGSIPTHQSNRRWRRCPPYSTYLPFRSLTSPL